MHSHYLWFASWAILEDFCHQRKTKKGKIQQHNGVPPVCQRNIGGGMLLSIHWNVYLTKRSLAIACYIYKDLAMSFLDGLMKNMYSTKIQTYWTNNWIDMISVRHKSAIFSSLIFSPFLVPWHLKSKLFWCLKF